MTTVTIPKIKDTVYLTIVPVHRSKKVIGMLITKMTRTKPSTPVPQSIVMQLDLSAPGDIFDWTIPLVSIEIPSSAITADPIASVGLRKP